MVEILDRISSYSDKVALYGLSAVVIVAGLTKLSNPAMWLGYEPAWLQTLIPLEPTQFVYVTGGFETVLGTVLGMRLRSEITASIVFLWLLGITFTVASMGLWTIALRDFGLLVLAYSVAASEYQAG